MIDEKLDNTYTGWLRRFVLPGKQENIEDVEVGENTAYYFLAHFYRGGKSACRIRFNEKLDYVKIGNIAGFPNHKTCRACLTKMQKSVKKQG